MTVRSGLLDSPIFCEVTEINCHVYKYLGRHLQSQIQIDGLIIELLLLQACARCRDLKRLCDRTVARWIRLERVLIKIIRNAFYCLGKRWSYVFIYLHHKGNPIYYLYVLLHLNAKVNKILQWRTDKKFHFYLLASYGIYLSRIVKPYLRFKDLPACNFHRFGPLSSQFE